jgi:multiple sugar transport system permease protein
VARPGSVVSPVADGAGAAALTAPAPPATSRRRGVSIAGWSFVVPNLILVAVFLLIPLVLAFVISLQKRESLGDPVFLGINNYLDLFADSVFWESLWNTVLFTVCTVPVGMALGLGIATLLNGVLPGRTLYRSIIFLPLVISGVATGVLGAWLFDQYNGFFNNVLAVFGIDGPAWQSSGGWAMFSVILMTLWQRVGFDMLIYLAGLQGVGDRLAEVPPGHLSAARAVDVLPADHEPDLLVPDLRHRLRDDRRRS